MDSPESIPATPDETVESNPASPGSVVDDSSEASTPLDPPSAGSDAILNPSPLDLPRRVPSLRTVSDPQNNTLLNSTSSVPGALNNARRPPPYASNLPMDLMAKARALQQQRMGMARPGMATQQAGSMSAVADAQSPTTSGVSSPGGMPPNLRMPQMPLGRPLPPGFPKSSPAVPSATGRRPGPGPSLSERRAMKLGGLPGAAPGAAAGAPKLSDLNGGANAQRPSLDGAARDSKMNDFKNYIDAEKGWVTFEGAATITRSGVNFASGQTFSISLDEIDVMDELGKGNYGTVYKVRHARPKAPRFGQGLSSIKTTLRQNSAVGSDSTDSSSTSPDPTRLDGTSGVVMAMKEIRLELDEAKFTTILKELVILHECVSPYIIEFYGAFFQEGAVYMCIEYMDGGSIDKLYSGGIPENVLRKITFATIMGLKCLKEDHNIIHRDVKPTNILVNSKGQVKICDFGVSGNLVASIAKTNIGCQSYMAPERISGGGLAQPGAGTYSVQSDIWSLGLTIIECATGRYPYPPEISSTIFGQLNAIVEGEPPDLPTEGYSPAAQDFVRSSLNKVPAKRPTYPMLLAHPWLKSLSQPETIAEDEEPEEDDVDGELADGASKLSIQSGQGDVEVAVWVMDVLARKKVGLVTEKKDTPALHAAPLDSISPVTSPM